MFKIGFMASGGGSNIQAILNRIQDQSLQNVQAEFVITNNSKCGAADKARAAGLSLYHISSVTHPNAEQLSQRIVQIIQEHQIDLLVLAGYMKKIPDAVIAHLPNRIINIHPALLPSFGGEGHWGHHVHEAVEACGARISGATVHFVDGEYDHGKIIAQRAVALESTDNAEIIGAKVLKQEHDLYWRVVQAFAQGQVTVEQNKVHAPIL